MTAHPRRSGALLLVLSALLFGVMAVLTKRAAAHVPGPEVALVRFAVGVAGSAAYVLVGGRLRPVNFTALFLRGFFGGVAVLGFFIAISKLPVGLATLLNYTAPVVTAVLAALFLGEPLRLATVGALALTSIGVVVVVNAHAPVGRIGFGRWELVGIASAVMSGAAVTAIRWARRTDGHWEVFAAFCAVGVLVCAPMALREWVWPSPMGWVLMVGVGLVSLLAQLLFIHALGFVRAATAGVISQLTPISAMGLGVLWFGDPSSPEALFGAALTLGGVLWGALKGDDVGNRGKPDSIENP